MEPKYQKYYTSAPDWEIAAKQMGVELTIPPPPFTNFDHKTVLEYRKGQDADDELWAKKHPLSSVSYTAHVENITVSDGHQCPVKFYRSTRVPADKPLPLLFVTHLGGWTQGTVTSEERRLLWPLLSSTSLDLVVASVAYRLCPENTFDQVRLDVWDSFRHITSHPDKYAIDRAAVVLGGSSAGGGLALITSLLARDANIPIRGVLANVPMTCDPRHWPRNPDTTPKYEQTSYAQAISGDLTGDEMNAIWTMTNPSPTAGLSPAVSPLLGDLSNLPPHAVYVAGQDPLRDDAFAYAEKLKDSGTDVTCRIYTGVPHNFGDMWELEATRKWWQDLRADFSKILSSELS